MLQGPSISIQAIHPLLTRLDSLGIRRDRLFEECGIDPANAKGAEARIPLIALDAIWEHAATLTGDHHIGLHCAEGVEPDSFGILSYLGINSETWGKGLKRVCDYFRILSEGSYYERCQQDGQMTVFARHLVPHTGPYRQQTDFTVAVLHCYGKRYVGSSWALAEVFLEYPRPNDTREYQRLFASPVRFGAAESGLCFDARFLDSPLNSRDPSLVVLLERFAEQLMATLPRIHGTAQQVRQQLLASDLSTDVSLKSISKRVSMSPRTLQRQLSSEGTSLQKLLDEVRQSLAQQWLSHQRVSIAEVAFALGFSEPAAFHRAFKRWTGKTPTAYRVTSEL